ncbi:MAG: HIT family protein [Actinobacteria bacterium]|nr:HIT family protein [Actinomycetota bacterium]
MTTIFTRIINREIPGTFVHEDDLCVAFLSINPLADGHVLVIPREEVDHWIDLDAGLAAHLFQVSHRISRALSSAFPCERIGMIIAGYEVNHCHIHLVPTSDMSQLDFRNAARSIDRETLDANAVRIVAALASI